MSRRVSLPGASELFRDTQAESGDGSDSSAAVPETVDVLEPDREASTDQPRRARGSGRVRHDDKITVYVSSDELVALEQARLTLRAQHGMAIDRGRIVREAIAAVVADLNDNGNDSELVRRLSKS